MFLSNKLNTTIVINRIQTRLIHHHQQQQQQHILTHSIPVTTPTFIEASSKVSQTSTPKFLRSSKSLGNFSSTAFASVTLSEMEAPTFIDDETVQITPAETNLRRSKPTFMNGRYGNPFANLHSFPTFTEIFKWQMSARHIDPLEGVNLDKDLPVVKPNFKLWDTYTNSAMSDTAIEGLTYTWIGHATTFLQTDGFNILFDPIFSDRASAWQRIGPKRLRPVPCSVDELPPIDAIMISHNHYDHLDYNSIVSLFAKMTRERQQAKTEGKEERICHWIVPMGMKDWLINNIGINATEISELSWWDSVKCKLSLSKEMNTHSSTTSSTEDSDNVSVSSTTTNLKPTTVTAVPALHWTQRGIMDKCKVLWCGFVVETPKRKIYFSGDTAYCDVFKEIGDHFKQIDLAILPIGAYSPRQIMRSAHVDPAEAVQIMEDVRAVRSFGVHFGTFKLAQEPFLEPPKIVAEEIQKRGWKEDAFITTKHGETLELFVD